METGLEESVSSKAKKQQYMYCDSNNCKLVLTWMCRTEKKELTDSIALSNRGHIPWCLYMPLVILQQGNLFLMSPAEVSLPFEMTREEKCQHDAPNGVYDSS
jgi:hypothetical protein